MALQLAPEIREAVREALEQGATLDGSSGHHPKLRVPERLRVPGQRDFVVIPTTPSDYRANKNLIADMRRMGFTIKGRTHSAAPTAMGAALMKAAGVELEPEKSLADPRDRMAHARSFRKRGGPVQWRRVEKTVSKLSGVWDVAQASALSDLTMTQTYGVVSTLVKRGYVIHVDPETLEEITTEPPRGTKKWYIHRKAKSSATPLIQIKSLAEIKTKTVEPMSNGLPKAFWKGMSEAMFGMASAFEALSQ